MSINGLVKYIKRGSYLKNLCDGDLNFVHRQFRKLINELDIGDKGNITINIKASKTWMLLVMKQYLLENLTALIILKLLFQIMQKVTENVRFFKVESGMFDEAAEGCHKYGIISTGNNQNECVKHTR